MTNGLFRGCFGHFNMYHHLTNYSTNKILRSQPAHLFKLHSSEFQKPWTSLSHPNCFELVRNSSLLVSSWHFSSEYNIHFNSEMVNQKQYLYILLCIHEKLNRSTSSTVCKDIHIICIKFRNHEQVCLIQTSLSLSETLACWYHHDISCLDTTFISVQKWSTKKN